MAATTRTLELYIDYKSPYAYLAKDLAYDLARDTGVAIDWLPDTLDIPAFLGSATVDADGTVLEENRNAHQWRRVRYAYMDARREANRRGLTLRGPRKIFDSTLEQFWGREHLPHLRGVLTARETARPRGASQTRR